jgi:transcriptional regulator
MYTPPAFREDDPATLREMMRAARLATLVTATAEGLAATPLPLLLDETEGPLGTLYGHVARANPQWARSPVAEALAVFMGPDAYVSPSWYAAKREHGRVVPTWNYVAVHAHGPVEFFDDEARLREVVTRLTNLYEAARAEPWSVTDAPEGFVRSQLRGIVGLRLPVTRLEGKRKLSQNRPEADREGVVAGLAASTREDDRRVAPMIPLGPRPLGADGT